MVLTLVTTSTSRSNRADRLANLRWASLTSLGLREVVHVDEVRGATEQAKDHEVSRDPSISIVNSEATRKEENQTF
jgi:hypothetical protein